MLNFKITTEQTNETKGTFSIEPLELGFGHTIGNTLRRVLLSSLEGGAITSVKISGVSHQFSTIPGVSEDVIQIILNLKKVRLSIDSDKPVRMSIKASGKGEVKASDINTGGSAQVVNPDAFIASLNSPSAKLNIELTADKGVGYVLAEERKLTEIGVIPIDSIYTPVVEVNYKVESTRVGRDTNYDKLVMEITTDGTITPFDALIKASKILSDYFRQVVDPTVDEEKVVTSRVDDSLLNMSVEELDLAVRITNALKAMEIDTVSQLLTHSKSHLLKAKNLGVQSVNLISQKLSERGLALSEA